MEFTSKKQQLAGFIGSLLLPIFPNKTRQLRTENFTLAHSHKDYGLLNKLLRLGLLYKIITTQNTHELAEYHLKFWQSKRAAEYHRHSMSADTLFSKFPNTIDNIIALQEKGKRFDTLCELGSGSGQVLYYLAEKLPDIKHFIGIDLSADTIAECKQKYTRNDMQFIAADGNKWIRENAKPQWLYVSHGGVLEYFPEDILLDFFSYLAEKCTPCGLLLLEPRGVNHDVTQSNRSQPYSAEYSFSHHYEHLLTQAGFTIHSAEITPFSNQCHFICIVASCGMANQ